MKRALLWVISAVLVAFAVNKWSLWYVILTEPGLLNEAATKASGSMVSNIFWTGLWTFAAVVMIRLAWRGPDAGPPQGDGAPAD